MHRHAHDALGDNSASERAAVLALLALAALAGACAATLHWLDADADLVDRWTPATLAIVYVALLLALWRRPQTFERTLWAAIAVSIVGLGVPTLWHLWRALQPGAAPLVETLPPLPPALVPLALVTTVFLRPRVALLTAALAWLTIGAPVLVYLLAHPMELLSPRGQEVAIVLGPVMLLVLAFIPLHREMERRMEALQRERSRMQRLAERDPLTGLANRRAADARLAAWRRDDVALQLTLIDIDHFKAINDRHGHAAGDAVLRELAQRGRDWLRDGELFARWGGEEFLHAMPVADASAASAHVDALRVALEAAPFSGAGRVTASFGSTRVAAGESLDEALQRADEALYAAKAAGRNRIERR